MTGNLLKVCTLLGAVLLAVVPAVSVPAAPNYTGTTGHIWTPSGRMMETGEMRFTMSMNDPFSEYYPRTWAANFAPVPFLEVGGRFVEYDNDRLIKDKVPDFKIRILKENENIPALAIGVSDFGGTEGHFAEYIALSKMMGDFDITLGYGGDLFGLKRSGVETRYLDGIFAGVEWHMRETLSFIVEYDPTDAWAFYDDDDLDNINVGVRWSPVEWLDCGYAYQRGDHGIHVSVRGYFDIEAILPYWLLDW